jgi:hypothetical protein
MVTDLHHFLDLTPDTPGPARRLADQLFAVVRAGSAGDTGRPWQTALPCRRRPKNRPCPGRLVVLRSEDPTAPIQWQCSACGDDGVISNWQETPYDLRRRALVLTDNATAITVPLEVAEALQDLQLLDPDCERIVFRAHLIDQSDGAILSVTDDDLEQLIGAVAAEANHEPNRRRQKRLDAAFDALNDAAAD